MNFMKRVNKKLKKYFVPNDENENQPYFLRDKSTRVVLASILFLEIIALVLVLPFFSTRFDYLASVLPNVLIEKTNESRIELGKSELAYNELLEQAAQLKAKDMAENGYFAHTSPDGKTPWYFINQSGYKYENAGENLAVNFVDSDDVHDAWMNSPTHRENILRDRFSEIGIATAEGTYKGKKALFVVQYFGEPVKIAVAPTVQSPTTLSAVDLDTPVSIEIPTTVVAPVNTNVQVLGAESVVTPSVSETITKSSQPKLSWYEKVISSSRNNANTVIALIALMVFVSLILKIVVKIKVQYPKLILNGFLILIIASSFIYINGIVINLFTDIA